MRSVICLLAILLGACGSKSGATKVELVNGAPPSLKATEKICAQQAAKPVDHELKAEPVSTEPIGLRATTKSELALVSAVQVVTVTNHKDKSMARAMIQTKVHSDGEGNFFPSSKITCKEVTGTTAETAEFASEPIPVVIEAQSHVAKLSLIHIVSLAKDGKNNVRAELSSKPLRYHFESKSTPESPIRFASFAPEVTDVSFGEKHLKIATSSTRSYQDGEIEVVTHTTLNFRRK